MRNWELMRLDTRGKMALARREFVDIDRKCWALEMIKSGLGLDRGEGNGPRLQYSCLENPMDGGAW